MTKIFFPATDTRHSMRLITALAAVVLAVMSLLAKRFAVFATQQIEKLPMVPDTAYARITAALRQLDQRVPK